MSPVFFLPGRRIENCNETTVFPQVEIQINISTHVYWCQFQMQQSVTDIKRTVEWLSLFNRALFVFNLGAIITIEKQLSQNYNLSI